MADRPGLRQLHYFVQVAEAGSLSLAAQALGLSQPSLSVQMSKLERRLGTPLLERTTRGVSLTDSGSELLVEARAILSHVDSSLARVRATALCMPVTLRVGIPNAINQPWVKRWLERIEAQVPNVRLQLDDMVTRKQIDALIEGALDLGLVRHPEPHPRVAMVDVIEEPIAVFLPPSHPLLAKDVLEMSDLATERILFPSRSIAPAFYDQTIDLLRRTGIDPERVEYTNSWTSNMWCDNQQIGVTARLSVVSYVHPDGWESRRLADDPLRMRTSLAWPRYSATRDTQRVADATMVGMAISALR